MKMLFSILILIACNLAFALPPAFIVPRIGGTNLVGWWTFNRTNNDYTVNDFSGMATVLTNINQTPLVSGSIGSAFGFNGTSQYLVNGSPNVPIISGFTLSAWVHLNATFPSGFSAIVGRWADSAPRSYLLDFRSAGSGGSCLQSFSTIASDGTLYACQSTVDQTYFTNGFHLATAVFDLNLGTYQIYVDGLANGTPTAVSIAPFASTLPLEIGNHNSNTAFFNGIIDDVRIYNRALNTFEVLQLYNGGMGTP